MLTAQPPNVMGDAVDPRYQRGLDVYASQFHMPREEVASWFVGAVGERFGEEAILAGGGAWADDELSLRDRSLVVVAALITLGGAEAQLRTHTRWAVEHGCKAVQLEALATLLAVYIGYPHAGNGMTIVREELSKLS